MSRNKQINIASVIEKDGRPEYAVIAWEDYQDLLSAAEEREEDLADLTALMAVQADENEAAIPADLVRRLIDGEHPVSVWCAHRGIKPVELARRSGVSQSYVSQIITGRRVGSINTFRAIAHVLGVTVDDLLPPGEAETII